MTSAPHDRPHRVTVRRRPGAGTRPAALAVVLAAAVVACAEEPPSDMSTGEYRSTVDGICESTTARLDALVPPADEGAVAEFATAVAAALGDEAELVRDLAVPDDLASDHRAFVRNTDEQSAGWSELATTPTGDTAFADLARAIGELTLGRNDLAAGMGLDACVRTPTGPT